MYRFLTGSGWISLAIALCGCGGGGVESAPPPPASPPAVAPPPATTPPPPPVSGSDGMGQTSEYQSSNAANHINVLPAWQSGASGHGVKIGFIDSGLNPNDPEFAGRIDPASRDIASDRSMSDQYGHGTATASLAASARNDSGIVGVAPSARIIMMKADEPGSCDGGCSYEHGNIAEGIKLASQAGAKVINISLGGDASSGIIDAVKQAASKGVIFVVAAANEGNSEPSKLARDIAAAASGQAIIVGSIAENLSGLASFSNKAGSFQNWYLAAPGQYVRVATTAGGTDVVSGTSFSAPVVAGAAALLRQAFPNLSASQVVQLLLTTADDLGTAGVDNVYGSGRLNVGRAFQPVGQTSFAGTTVSASATFNGSPPAAAGDALAAGSLNAVILDEYSRAFTMDLARTIRARAIDRPLEQALFGVIQSTGLQIGPMGVAVAIGESSFRSRTGAAPLRGSSDEIASARVLAFSALGQLGRDRTIGFSKSGGVAELESKLAGNSAQPFMINETGGQIFGLASINRKALALRQAFGGSSIGVSAERGRVREAFAGDRPAPYTAVRFTFDERIANVRLKGSISHLTEQATVLGGRLSSAFGNPGAKSVFVDAGAEYDGNEGWRYAALARRGYTTFSSGAFQTSAYLVEVGKRGVAEFADEITVRLSQPLRVEQGGLSMLLPISYDYESETAKLGISRFSLSPSSRELVVEAGYSRPFKRGSMRFNLFTRTHPGHSAGAAPDVGAALSLRTRF